MTLDLTALARPTSRADAIRAGLLVDTTAAAAFLGFRYPAAMSAAAWDEVVGTPGLAATRAEKDGAARRLRQVWADAVLALGRYQHAGVVLPALSFTSRNSADRKVGLRLVLSHDGGSPVLTLYLGGET